MNLRDFRQPLVGIQIGKSVITTLAPLIGT